MGILLVMSNDVDTRLLLHLLAPLHQHVAVAATMADAERSIRARSFAVVVIDITSLDGNGLDLVRLLDKESFEGAIIVLSPSTDVMAKVQALEEGADDYIVYPYEPAELLARVKAALRRRSRRGRQTTGGVMRVGSVGMDVNELDVSVPGKRRIRLTPNEMRLLLYLMTHTQRAVDQQELLGHLFGADTQQIASNAVGVYVRRVRRKIERDPDNPRYVVTIRGQGYQFRTPDEDGEGSPTTPTAES